MRGAARIGDDRWPQQSSARQQTFFAHSQFCMNHRPWRAYLLRTVLDLSELSCR
jgi:hypothetical protein